MPGLGSQLQNIGTAMAGFSAGLQGNLPQFQAVQNQKIQQEQQNALLQQEQRMKMEEERRKTMFSDAAAALQLTKMGNLDGVVQLGLNRLQGLQQLSQQDPNIDPSDTQRVTQLAIAARNGDEEALELLTAELESAVQVGQAIGVLEAPKKVEGATELGKLQQDLDAGLISPEQYSALSKQLTTPEPEEVRPAATDLGKLRQDLNAGLITQEQYDQGVAAIESGPTRAPTATQSLAASYAERTANSNDVLTRLGSQFTGIISNAVGLVPQRFRSDERQQFDQATRDFINATLRRESGAAIAESEFENARLQYIPQPGDGEAVLEQKKRNRDTVMAALAAEAGPALDALRDRLPASTVMIMGRPYAVGAEVTNAQGQRGRVEADGTITVLD